MQEITGAVVRSSEYGLLLVKMIESSGEVMNVTVCADNFDWWKANTICRSFGNKQGEWNIAPINSQLVTK